MECRVLAIWCRHLLLLDWCKCISATAVARIIQQMTCVCNRWLRNGAFVQGASLASCLIVGPSLADRMMIPTQTLYLGSKWLVCAVDDCAMNPLCKEHPWPLAWSLDHPLLTRWWCTSPNSNSLSYQGRTIDWSNEYWILLLELSKWIKKAIQHVFSEETRQ
jgi:hypothetical protein